MTAGGIRDVEIAAPTSDAMKSLKIPSAAAAPDNRATKQPTHKLRISPLKFRITPQVCRKIKKKMDKNLYSYFYFWKTRAYLEVISYVGQLESPYLSVAVHIIVP